MDSSPKQKVPTHGAVPLDAINALLKYFQETPMPFTVSNPFIQELSKVSLITLQEDAQEPAP